jgi:hypothetical protein
MKHTYQNGYSAPHYHWTVHPCMTWCLLNTTRFIVVVALLLENKHKYLVKGDIIKYE